MEKIIAAITATITTIIITICLIYFLQFNKNKCIEKGGKVITNAYGVFNKCIYGAK